MALQAPGRIDLQPGYYLVLFTSWCSTLDEDNPPGEAVAAVEHHKRPDTGEDCAGRIVFRGMRAAGKVPPEGDSDAEWDIVQEDPLTLAPSIRCRTCGAHGHIQNGKWENA